MNKCPRIAWRTLFFIPCIYIGFKSNLELFEVGFISHISSRRVKRSTLLCFERGSEGLIYLGYSGLI